MRILPRKPMSTDAFINLVILCSGSCLALCLYLLGPAFPVIEQPAFRAPTQPATLAQVSPQDEKRPAAIEDKALHKSFGL